MSSQPRRQRTGLSLAAIFLLTALVAVPAAAQQPKLVLLENDDIVGGAERLNYPVLISNERGYRIRCAEQADEEAVIRGLGFLTSPSTVLTALDPEIAAAEVLSNPLLCPSADDYPIKVFAHNGPEGLKFYLQFPDSFGSSSFTDRIYVPGCSGLVEALALDLDGALDADPTPFFTGKIHEIACLTGTPIAARPETFSEWCLKGDRSAAETATVMALLDSTPGGVAALDDPVGCAAAETFLESVPALNLSGFGLSDLAPVSVLTHLNSLTLANNQITDVAPLADLRAAIFLDLSGNRLSSLAALTPLTALTALELADNEISNLRPLATLAALTSLDLSGNQITDVSPLEFNQALQTLDLGSNQLTGPSLEPLTGLSALLELDLSHNAIESLEHLGQFSSTTEIDLTGNPVFGSEALSFQEICILHREDATPYGFTLRAMLEASGQSTCEAAAAALNSSPALNLSGKSISDLEPVTFVENLTSLNLSGNAIVDLNPLASMTGLSSLDISANNISDVRPIAPLVGLTTFLATDNPVQVDDYLSACLMKDHEDVLSEDQRKEMEAFFELSGEETCPGSEDWLRRAPSITLRAKGLRTLSYFEILQNVRYLDLADNELDDVSVLEPLPQLVTLRLEGNQLPSLTSLLRFDDLKFLSIDRNPMSSINGVANLRSLEQIHLTGTQVKFIRPLGDLPELQRASLFGLDVNYAAFEDYCLVHKLDTQSLGSARAFLIALEDRMAADGVDVNDCDAADQWARNLAVLNLNKKNLTSIAPVRTFPKLKEFHVFDNRITDASPLIHLVNLEKVNMAKNRLSQFPVLRSTKLRTLYLNQNQLSLASSMRTKTSLKTLRLDDNRIMDARPLQGLSQLDYLDLRNNRLANLSLVLPVLTHKPFLKGNPVCPASQVHHHIPALVQACNREPTGVIVLDHILRNNDLIFRNVVPPAGIEIDRRRFPPVVNPGGGFIFTPPPPPPR